MSTIVTRAGKGSPLTNTEVDANFDNLNNDKYQSGDSPNFVKVVATQTGTSPNFHAIGTSAGASNAPTILLERDSVSPANGDNMGVVQWQGNNDADESTLYAQLFTEIVNVADGSESGRMDLQIRTEGTLKNYLSLWTNGAQAEASINNAGTDIDFRVKGNSDDSLLYSDASLNRIGIGTSTPASKLDVNGQAVCKKLISTVANGRPLDLNRTSTNGAILQFQLDGADKGNVGVNSIDDLYITNDTGGVRISETEFKPTLSGYNNNDNAVNLGSAGNRFKNIYLSEGAFLGGTGSVNQLDDYETGTWTCGISNSAGSQTSSTTRVGQYTKIGRMVHVSVNMNNIDASAFTGGALRITGLPFAVKNNSAARGHGVCQINSFVDAAAPNYYIQGVQGTQAAQIKHNKNDDTAQSVDVAKLDSNNTSTIIFDLTYIV